MNDAPRPEERRAGNARFKDLRGGRSAGIGGGRHPGGNRRLRHDRRQDGEEDRIVPMKDESYRRHIRAGMQQRQTEDAEVFAGRRDFRRWRACCVDGDEAMRRTNLKMIGRRYGRRRRRLYNSRQQVDGKKDERHP